MGKIYKIKNNGKITVGEFPIVMETRKNIKNTWLPRAFHLFSGSPYWWIPLDPQSHTFYTTPDGVEKALAYYGVSVERDLREGVPEDAEIVPPPPRPPKPPKVNFRVCLFHRSMSVEIYRGHREGELIFRKEWMPAEEYEAWERWAKEKAIKSSPIWGSGYSQIGERYFMASLRGAPLENGGEK